MNLNLFGERYEIFVWICNEYTFFENRDAGGLETGLGWRSLSSLRLLGYDLPRPSTALTIIISQLAIDRKKNKIAKSFFEKI